MTQCSPSLALSVLAIGDLHYKKAQLPEMNILAERILQLVDKVRPDLVVVLGDTLHNHETINSHCLTAAIRLLARLDDMAPTYLLIGNHDRPNNSDFLSEVHPFTAIRKWPNTTVVDRVVSSEVNGHRLLFLPFVKKGLFHEALQVGLDCADERASPEKMQSRLAEYTAIFAHQEFRGAKFIGSISKDGDVWPASYPLVISGHIHEYDQPADNILYVGSPMQHNFGDSDDKAVSLITWSGSAAPCSGKESAWQQQRFDLGLTKKYVYTIVVSQLADWLPPPEGDVKLVIQASKSESKMLDVKQLRFRPGVIVMVKVVSDGETELSHLVDPSLERDFAQSLRERLPEEMLPTYDRIMSAS